MIDWRKEGKPIIEYKDLNGKLISRPQNLSYNKKMGMSYGKRGFFLSVNTHEQGKFFTNEGQGIFIKNKDDFYPLLALLNSRLLRGVINEYCGQHKENGYVKLLPINSAIFTENIELAKNTNEIIFQLRTMARFRIEHSETISPKLSHYESLKKYIEFFQNYLEHNTQLVQEKEEEINSIIFSLYQIDTVSIEWIKNRTVDMPFAAAGLNIFDWSSNGLISEILDLLLGYIFGRWDIRYAILDLSNPELSNPIDTIPACPPGMLQNSSGLPAEPKDVPADYPLRISWSGIIVDDEGHPEDIITRIREAIEVIWKDKANNIEQEACEILGVRSLREYFAKPAKFFADHLKRYSKSRRQAPIYWPLSTPSGSYTLWLYYHRLTDQTLYTCVNNFVGPKLKQVSDAAENLRTKSNRSSQEEKDLEKLSDLALELKDFHDELLRIAGFWKPDLNDGVQITAAPLWKLFQHKPWQTKLKQTWKDLEKGTYDWAHLAYSIWPERVIRASHKDRSFAIAHDLEDDLWGKIETGTDRQGNPKTKWAPKKLNETQLKHLISRCA